MNMKRNANNCIRVDGSFITTGLRGPALTFYSVDYILVSHSVLLLSFPNNCWLCLLIVAFSVRLPISGCHILQLQL